MNINYLKTLEKSNDLQTILLWIVGIAGVLSVYLLISYVKGQILDKTMKILLIVIVTLTTGSTLVNHYIESNDKLTVVDFVNYCEENDIQNIIRELEDLKANKKYNNKFQTNIHLKFDMNDVLDYLLIEELQLNNSTNKEN